MGIDVSADLAGKARLTIRNAVLRSAAFGAAFAVMLCAFIGAVRWYNGRPKTPKPWNKQAITAEFGKVSTEGSDDHLAFLYILQNNTAEDLRLDSDVGVSISAKLKGKGEFATFSQRIFTVTYPIFVPSTD